MLAVNRRIKREIRYRNSLNMPHFPDKIEYFEKFRDNEFEYKYVLLPEHVYRKMPQGRLLSEEESRILGV